MTIHISKLDRADSPILRAALITALLAAGAINTVQADGLEPRRVTVSYGDLNLESAGGNQALYTRIRRAAKQVCQQPDTKLLATRSEVASCMSRAIAAAVRQVPSPRLASLHQQSKVL